MAHSAERKELVGKLITATTGFHRKEENFDISRQYLMSNLRFHRYLDVDRHKVVKSVEGLLEKFTIHSETRAGDTLKQRVQQFLDVQAFEREDVAKTDTHYAVLSFLLDMSNSPSVNPHIPSHEAGSEGESDDFDWFRYLTEDLDPLQTHFSDSTCDSEGSDVESLCEKAADGGLVGDVEVRKERVSQQVQASTNSLRKLLIPRYWAGESDCQLDGLAQDWSHHLSTVEPLVNNKQDCLMTEYQMVREVLWMLAGADVTFLSTWDEKSQSFAIRDDVNLTHTTKMSLTSALRALTHLATKLYQLRQFISHVTKDGDRHVRCRTYLAFSAACSDVLSHIDRFTASLTQRIKQEEVTATLMSVHKAYKEHGELIDVVHNIYVTAVLGLSPTERAVVSAAASSLLVACNEAVNNASMLDSGILQAVVRVFMLTLQPYLSIIDEWLTKGNLNDPYSEFVIKRNDTSCLDETFWDIAVQVTDVTSSFSSSAVLLQETLPAIADAGKSMEMLSQLGQLSVAIGKQEQPLYQVFTERFCEEVGWSPGSSTKLPHSKPTKDDIDVVADTLLKLQFYTGADSLMLSNVTSLFQEGSATCSEIDSGLLVHKHSHNMSHIGKVMSNSLKALIEERHRHVSQSLLSVLNHQCRLQHYMSMARKVYLLEANNIMSEFYNELFSKLWHSEQWRDALSLNITVQDCLQKAFPADAVRFNISLTEIHRSEFLPIQAIEEISLHYTVDWPIDVIYTSDCQEDYNRIFQFLLQIKLSKYCLDHLKFSDIQQSVLTNEVKQDVYMLRMRLLHFVNGMHDYTMRMILHSAANDLEDKLQSAADLESVIKSHRAYLTLIYDRCFLHKNNHVLHDCVLRLLNSALLFQKLWTDDLHADLERRLQVISTNFTKNLQNLTSFITSLIKTGSLPHLESLALTLELAKF